MARARGGAQLRMHSVKKQQAVAGSGWEAADGGGGGGLAGAEAAAFRGGPVPSVVDVPTPMQVEFQQSSLYVRMVPQIQFIDRVLQPPVCGGDVYSQCELWRRPLRSHKCCSWV